MIALGFDNVWLQPIMVPHWVRGEKEEANFTSNNTTFNVPICTLGGSIAMSENGMADFIILDKHIMEVKPEKIPYTRVEETYMGGESVK